ncbi:hypothetical protein SAMN05421505_103305 [Sinosporangium album]|uniref:Sporulation and spore germination n=1 Tax=Sinosporangium album TaxID=504805 RepID=A0A1G7TJN2_9ACTN|nr:hypothetical protein [Sinosporangium album]SDG35485.1 hypothetical protein SAMN05421505_103305 [Sinosporangium album]
MEGSSLVSVRRTALPVCTAALAMACGCGIQPTDVIDAGNPPWGPASGTRLYFVSGDRLATAGRPGDGLGPDRAVALLLRGPTRAERERGLTAALPAKLSVEVAIHGDTVTLTPGQALSRLAEGQLVCTAAEAHAARSGLPTSAVEVVVEAGPPTRCEEYLH